MKSILEQLKQFIQDNQNDIILIIGIILIALISFGAGRLTSYSTLNENEPVLNSALDIAAKNPTESPSETLKPEISPVQIIGNKNSKIYHYPWCSGAKNMKEENKVFFNSVEEAKNAGYKPAGNCPGL